MGSSLAFFTDAGKIESCGLNSIPLLKLLVKETAWISVLMVRPVRALKAKI
jgi:hypothetical protein